VSATVTKRTRRAIQTQGAIALADGTVLADADALFLIMPEERRRELERRYSRIDEAFARVREAVADEEHARREHLRT
jgi:hypothetical protein